MSKQSTELRQRLKKAFDYVAEKKGSQWAKETQAEFKSTERFLTSMSEDNIDDGEVYEVTMGKLGGWLVPPELSEIGGESTFFPSGKRITPHDTGNLIEAISVSSSKHGTVREFSVGVDYNKLNRPRYLYSWLFNRKGHPGVYVKRPGDKKSGDYVLAANKNSDERPYFLVEWERRGKANTERIFR